MKRVMCVYFPEWPLQRLRHERSELRDKPVIIIDGQTDHVVCSDRSHAVRAAEKPDESGYYKPDGSGYYKLRESVPRVAGQSGAYLSSNATKRPATRAARQNVILCSAEAARLGVRQGMPVAEALAIDRRLFIEKENPGRDLHVFKRLAKWAERYSPIVGLEEGSRPQSLLLDISGCGPCFHGEDRLLKQATREFAEQGWTARIAIADTIGAAWGLAHYGRTPCLVTLSTQPEARRLVPGHPLSDALDLLPLAALRLPTDILDLLAKLGLERIGQLAALPRSSLSQRFGPAVLQRLDQMLGDFPETLVSQPSIAPVQAVWRFDWPTDRRELLDRALAYLIERIHQILDGRQHGARRIECWFYHEAAAPICAAIHLFRPSQSPPYLQMLLRTRLEQVRLEQPVAAMRLYVPLAEPLSDSQFEFFESRPLRGRLQELSGLIDCLSSRVGPEAVTQAILIPDAQPEYAARCEPMTNAECQMPNAKRFAHSSFSRPLRLWPAPVCVQATAVVPEGPPIRFRWANEDYRVLHAWGPERIETGWWRGNDVQRDYYVVATQRGNRFWLFRRRDDGRWFLHGCFD